MKKKVKTFTPLPITGPILAAANAWFQKEDETNGMQKTAYFPQNPKTKEEFLELVDSLEYEGYLTKSIQQYKYGKPSVIRIKRTEKFFKKIHTQKLALNNKNINE